DKPRKVYKRTKENEQARRNSVDAESHMQNVS
ncbi:DNA-binding protein, partial [Salmonella enterica subsp. diarizonae]|nr:DNA-binding protein [Salmonella enterica subsp. diarizonae]